MAEVKWIKIMTDIFDDEKIMLIENLPKADSIIVIWFKLLCLAGKQNNSGVFTVNDKIPYTEKMLASIFRRKEDVIKKALKVFEDYGMIEIINGTITIPNWGKHQSFDKIEKNNAYMRNYMREYRNKQKNLTEKQKNINSKTNVNINSKTDNKINSKTNVSSLDKEEEKEIEEDIEYSSSINNKNNYLYSKDAEKLQKVMLETIGTTNINNIKECIEYLEKLPIELIEYALKKTARIERPSWQYTIPILENYIKRGFKTLEQAEADDLKHKSKSKVNETKEDREVRQMKVLEELDDDTN